MKNILILLLLGASLLACQPTDIETTTNLKNQPDNYADDPRPGRVEQNVIYGDDNRLDIFQITDKNIIEKSKSTVAFIQKSELVSSGLGFVIKGSTFGQTQMLCSTERFREQPAAAFCSGSLVGPDLVLTAGHCVESVSDCQNLSVVFDYAVRTSGVMPSQFSDDQVFSCKEIVHSERKDLGADFAIIRLDRAVVGRKPLVLHRSSTMRTTDGVYVIGHPSGIPMKVTQKGSVRRVDSSAGFFVTNLDTYGGNSGSAVFNSVTHEVEGVLVRGDQDFIFNGGCQKSKVCTETSCRGEDVTLIERTFAYIPEIALGEDLGGQPQNPSPPIVSEEKFSVTSQLNIPDRNSKGVASILNVNSVPAGRSIFVKVNIIHTYIGDLTVSLESPDGKKVILHNQSGKFQKNIIGTYGADLKAFQSLESFKSVLQKGNWKLTIVDSYSKDVGILVDWALIFKN